MKRSADLLIVGARIWSGVPVPDADALAVADGQVVARGRAADLSDLIGKTTRVVDVRGATVSPGLVDAHIHLLAWARSADELELGDCPTRADALARVSRYLERKPLAGIVVGRGWDASTWEAPPERAPLDALSPDRPVLLYSRDYHNLWVNGAALRRAGIGPETRDPMGGWITRGPDGAPTGLLRENAMALVAALESPNEADDERQLDIAVGRLHAAGVTAVHCFEGPEAMRRLRRIACRPSRPLRILMHLARTGLEHAIELGLTSGWGDDRFRLGAVKLFADGTLGSRTAALLEPYEGSGASGDDLLSARELREIVRIAFEAKISVAVHAIGDRACRSTLDAFEASAARIPSLALPPRVEHIQLLDRSDAPRFARLGVAASMQPSHAPSDRDYAERYWGARCERSYPWRTLLDHGAVVAFGSDAPVEPPLPAMGLHAAVTRTRPSETRAFVPEQRVSLDEALVAYTEAPARLSMSWPRLGRLDVGAVADLVVWSGDLHDTPPADLWRVRPRLTVVGGEVVFDDEAAGAERHEPAARAEGVAA